MSHPADPNTSFEKRITAMRDSLYTYALTLTKDHFEADDLVQDTLLKALGCETPYEEEGHLRAWLCTILRHKFIDQARRHQRRRVKDIQDYENAFSAPPDVSSQLNCSDIRRGLKGLRGTAAEVMLLRAEGYKFEEIAEKLDLSLSNAKVKAFYAYKKLGKLGE